MGAVYCLVACLLLYVEQGIGLSASTSPPDEHGVFTLTLQMPDVVSNTDDLHMCTAVKLGPEETYISVGLKVSGNTGINYLVLQMHYADAFPAGVTDNSGITLSMTRTRPEQQVGQMILGSYGVIPPQRPVVLLDSMCQMNLTYPLYPIGYITHSHNIGVVISGYRVRNGVWTNIGRMSPRSPQALYPVNNPGMDIQNGDILTTRCIMNSMTRTTNTMTGPNHKDEMINFYITYSTRNPETLETIYCFKNNENYTWLSTFKAEEIPPESTTIEGFPEAEKIKKMFIWP